ncbi:hypothetical protein VN24_25515 [Paenibacillus beijingensis]|uniref:Uncharacterized protein n=1 Tax=Paenibacillus beijingensis TaxID=1126833 RepID=A0A0D5NQN7_9BACL|nr:hypothetical protein VN24_25515 [Paenibacillus beijingensis]
MNERVLNRTQEDLQFRWQSGVGGPFLAKPAAVQELSIEIACLEGKPAIARTGIPGFYRLNERWGRQIKYICRNFNAAEK